MSKLKKVLLMCTAYALVAVLAVGGTFAYLQDDDSAVNVMTLGNVQIEQIEQERDENGKLVEFVQAKPAYPAVGNIAWDETKLDVNGTVCKVFDDGLKNVVDKIVTVNNTGKSDAYVRTIVAIEAPEGDPNDLIHINWNNTGVEFEGGFVTKIDGVDYYIVSFVYTKALAAGAKSAPSLMQVFLDSKTTNEDCAKFGGSWEILVKTQAVQAAGFADAKTALDTAFGTVTAAAHPWADGVALPTVVTSAAELEAAIAAGTKDIVVKGAELSEKLPPSSQVNVTFVDCTITGNNAYCYANNVTFSNCTFDSGLANAAIHFDKLYGEAVFNNCTFTSGKVQIGKGNDEATATFNNCTFAATTQTHSIWTEMGIRVYVPTTFNNCEFNNRVVMAGFNGLSVTFNSCTMNGGTPVYYVDNTDGIIRGGNVPTVIIK